MSRNVLLLSSDKIYSIHRTKILYTKALGIQPTNRRMHCYCIHCSQRSVILDDNLPFENNISCSTKKHGFKAKKAPAPLFLTNIPLCYNPSCSLRSTYSGLLIVQRIAKSKGGTVGLLIWNSMNRSYANFSPFVFLFLTWDAHLEAQLLMIMVAPVWIQALQRF